MNQRPQSVISVASTVTSSSSNDDKFPVGTDKLGIEESSNQNGFLRTNRSKNGRKGINHRDLYLSYIDHDHDGEDDDAALSDSDASRDSFYERSFEAIESLLESEMFPDSAIYSDQDDVSLSTAHSDSPGNRNGPVAQWRQSLCNGEMEDEDMASGTTLRLPSHVPNITFSESRKRSLVCSQAILEKLKHLEECAQFQKDDLSSPSFEGIKSIQERRKELDLWRSGYGMREDESETSSQHSTSTINTVIEVSPSKTTSFPSSRRCSDTESSGGNSPLTERAVSRTSARSHSQGHLSTVGEPMPKGWVKLLVGKLQGEGES